MFRRVTNRRGGNGVNADDKARSDMAYAIRLLSLALNRLATEIERPVRERPFKKAAGKMLRGATSGEE